MERSLWSRAPTGASDIHWRGLALAGASVVLYGPFFVAQAVARGMAARARGSIINICSLQSGLRRPSIVPYTASKGRLNDDEAMAAELGSSNLRVNGLAPGYFRTDLNEALSERNCRGFSVKRVCFSGISFEAEIKGRLVGLVEMRMTAE